MLLRFLAATVFSFVLLAAPLAAIAQRGPSTPEEHKQALKYIHHFEILEGAGA